ncbi:MAG: FxLYD domain-containing protein [Oscillospiraceae bacterium]|nr:FxLYD domain-containing protein [Oscillospiraceae bacterium]
MKKTVLILTTLALLLQSGCALIKKKDASHAVAAAEVSSAEASADDRPDDGAFVAAVGRALEARWDAAAAYTETELAALTVGQYQEYLSRCVEAERAEAGHLWDFNFHDKDLIAAAQTYYHGLELQREGADYARTESLSEYNRTWVLGYYYRVSAVYDLYELFGLDVGEQYRPALREFIAPYHTAKKQVAFQEFADTLPGTLRFEPDGDGCYSALIENTTEYTIFSMSVDVSFYDAAGVIVYQTSAWVSNLRPGEIIRSTVTVDAEGVVSDTCSVTIYQ